MGRYYSAAAAGGPSYLLSENFEGAGYENAAWSESGTVDEDYTTTILAGSHSLGVTNGGSATYTFPGATADEVWGYCLYRPHTAAGDPNFINLFDASDNVLAWIWLNADGTVTVTDDGFHLDSTTATMTPGTTYSVWWRYKKGTGADGELQVWFNTSATHPGSGANDALVTNANGTAQVNKVRFLDSTATAGVAVFDTVRVDDAQILSSPS
jgi:hypothetical protein